MEEVDCTTDVLLLSMIFNTTFFEEDSKLSFLSFSFSFCLFVCLFSLLKVNKQFSFE